MHYIEYIPGTIARITDKPTRHGHKDVNLLSRYVAEFNSEVASMANPTAKTTVPLFVAKHSRFLLPCSS